LISTLEKAPLLSEKKQKELFFYLLEMAEKRQILITSLTSVIPGMGLIGWDGGVRLSECRTQLSCQNMYLYLVKTNLDQNRPDSGNNQKTVVEYTVGLDKIIGKVSFTINHNESSVPGKNLSDISYLRIYLPDVAHLTSARINNRSVISGLLPVSTYNNLVGWGFLVNDVSSSASALDIEYEQPLSTRELRFHLNIDIPNQPGIGDNIGNLIVNYPKQWQASTSGQPVVATPGYLRYNTSSRDYQKVGIDFVKR